MSQALLLLTYLTKDNTQIQVPTYMCIPMMSFVGISPTFQSHHSSSLQKIVAFENAFERLMDIIEVEGYSDGGQCLSVRLCVCLSVPSSVYFPDCLFALFTSLPVCPAFRLLICMYVCTICLLLLCLMSLCPLVCLFISLIICEVVCLSDCLLVCLVVCLIV